jgi:beta-glucosidase
MNWEVYPECIYHTLKKYSAYKNIPELMITENGAAFHDEAKNGEVDDSKE